MVFPDLNAHTELLKIETNDDDMKELNYRAKKLEKK